ncbi:MAG TPA: ROK family protein [Terriglobales bacterium]|nr:ROK family protein [Terriglobales bacterium]
MADLLYAGVDVGGTKVAAGLVDASGRILSQIRVPMISHSSPEAGLKAVLNALDQITAGSSGLVGIGICSPGPLDPFAGIILNPPNLPCWRNFPLAESVQKVYPVKVKVDNDANAAALAEARWGAARGYKNVFYATIGTGIGTGIVFDGKMFHGRTGAGAEGGHVSIDYKGPVCGCGKPGCIEVLASGNAIARRAREGIAAGAKSTMVAIAGGNVDAIRGETVGKAFLAGDPFAKQLIIETIEMLALWLANMIDLLDPEVIVIGGGAAMLYQPFYDQLHERTSQLAVNPRANQVPLRSSHYGAHSGIAGGAALCA